MGELGEGVLGDVPLEALPVSLVVAHLAAPGTDRQEPAEGTRPGQRLLESGDETLALGARLELLRHVAQASLIVEERALPVVHGARRVLHRDDRTVAPAEAQGVPGDSPAGGQGGALHLPLMMGKKVRRAAAEGGLAIGQPEEVEEGRVHVHQPAVGRRAVQGHRDAVKERAESLLRGAQGLLGALALLDLGLKGAVQAGVAKRHGGLLGEELDHREVTPGEILARAAQADGAERVVSGSERRHDDPLVGHLGGAGDRLAQRMAVRAVKDHAAPGEDGLAGQAAVEVEGGGQHLSFDGGFHRRHGEEQTTVGIEDVHRTPERVQDAACLGADARQHLGGVEGRGDAVGGAQQALLLPAPTFGRRGALLAAGQPAAQIGQLVGGLGVRWLICHDGVLGRTASRAVVATSPRGPPRGCRSAPPEPAPGPPAPAYRAR